MVKATGSASEPSSESRLTVAPSTPVIGAEVSGVDLREPLTPVLRAELRRLLLRHRVLFLRDQQIDTGQQVAFAENFGDMLVFRTGSDPHPGYPGVDQVGIHQVHPAPQAPPSEASRARRFRWHIDASARLVPPAIIVVRAIGIPPTGGDTFWSSGVAAYQGLSDDMKEGLEGLYVTHDRTWWQHEGRDIDHPLISHRLVRTHPETGEKHLFLNSVLASSVIGMNPDASDDLIATLTREYDRPGNQVRFEWSPGAIVIWDNRVVQNYTVQDYGDFPRHVDRIFLAHFGQPQTEP